MPTLNGRNFSGVVGLNLREANGCIRFETPKITPTTTSGERLLWVNSSNQLIFDSGATSLNISTISAGGGGADWDSIYANDKTLTISGTTLTFALTHATNDGLTITGSAGSAGDCLQITNAGSGSDIKGTSAAWSISKTGAAVLTGITGCNSLVAAANLALDATAAGTITLAGTSTGAITLTTAVSCTAALTVGTTLTVGTGATFSAGLVDLIDNSNLASTLRITNDTQTTYGNASDAGMIVFRSESLTTGALLHLSLDETPLAGGYFLRCWSQDLGSAAFTIGELGVTTIAGSASGTAALTLTAGDLIASDGQLSVTRVGDNAVTLTVVNDTATTASSVVISGSGVFTGSTTTSFMTVTPSGLTTGTAVYLPVAAITQGKGLHITAGASLTTGSLLFVQDTGAACAITSGTIATLDETATAANANRTGQTLSVSSSRTVTAGAAADNFSNLSVTRAAVINGAGTFSSTGAIVNVTNTVTNTSGTITDTTKGINVAMSANGTGNGILVTHSAVAATAVSVSSVATSGIGLLVSQATGVMTTGSVVRISSSGVSTGTGQGTLLDLVSSGAQAAVVCSLVTAGLTTGTMLVMTANTLTTTGLGLSIGSTGTGMTSGSLLKVSSGTTGAVATNGIVNFTASGNYTSTSNQGFVGVIANSTAAGTIASIAGAALTTGVGLFIADGAGVGLTSGSLLRVATATTGAVATNGVVSISASGVYTSTSNVGLLDVVASATTGGTVFHLVGTALTNGYLAWLSAAAAYTGTGLVTLSAIAATSGTLVNILATGLTSGTAIKCVGNTAITTGSLLDLRVNSADVSASSIAYFEQTHASAASRVPLKMKQVAPTTTNYYKAQQIQTAVGTWTLFVGNGTNSPNGSLSGTAGDTCANCDSGKAYYCTGTTNWTAM